MEKDKSYFRSLFVFVSLITIAVILWNTFVFFNELKESETKKMEIWAAAYPEILQPSDLESNISPLPLKIITSNTATPMILHNYKDDAYDHHNIPESEVKTQKQIDDLIEQFKQEYNPIEIKDNQETYGVIYYGNSSIINKLKYYPIGILLIIIFFVGLVYFFFRTRKVAEQNRLWAGMAKETAHQIGTPLSSLVGWTEILRTEKINPEYVQEMEKDIFRLQTITDRFSKVGSVPNLSKKDVVSETEKSYDYLKMRSSKLITFELDFPQEPIYVLLNKQLYSWAIENLVKNAIDAMRGKGTITITIEQQGKHVHILIKDTGKGIPKKNFSKIFRPGFTTKKRGWGLGLSLTKRIIEDYHEGRVKVKHSGLDSGTTFQISLKLAE